MREQMNEFDRRIEAWRRNCRPHAAAALPRQRHPRCGHPRDVATGGRDTAESWGNYEPGKGFVLVRSEVGELDWSLFTYARYLNQKGLDETYTDSFGRTSNLDLRNDLQLAKATLTFKGWLFDPRFRYLTYVWTSNTSQGDPAQVVVAGALSYKFSDQVGVGAGIFALPTTRSTFGTFPNWLRNDNRTNADEFFRGSYTSGIWLEGSLVPGFDYKVMLGNNLSQLGVNAPQLDGNFNTVSAGVAWMPSTGEYGPGKGWGDYEYHQDLATLFGANYTHSREDAQGQPDTEGFENSQLRLSDGTLIFRNDPFGTGGVIRNATYEMFAVSGGMKYRGWSLDAEYYRRRLDHFADHRSDSRHERHRPGIPVAGIDHARTEAAAGLSVGLEDLRRLWRPLRHRAWSQLVSPRPEGTACQRTGAVPQGFACGLQQRPDGRRGNGWVLSMDAILAF